MLSVHHELRHRQASPYVEQNLSTKTTLRFLLSMVLLWKTTLQTPMVGKTGGRS